MPTKDEFKEEIIEQIKTCFDPEIPVNIYELGLIYDIFVDDDDAAFVKMTLTSPACPVAGTLPVEVENKVKEVEGITAAKVEIVWDPPWNMEMMSEGARLELGFM